MKLAHTCCSWVLKSMLRCCTLRRRWASAVLVEVGFASIDWQIPANDEVVVARKFVRSTLHRLKMFGIDITWIRASGRLADSVFMAVWRRVRKSVTDVMVASDEVHTSLAPM